MTFSHRAFLRAAGGGGSLALFLGALLIGAITLAQDPAAVKPDEPGWIREDIEAGYEQALATGKPLLVAFR